MFKNTLWNYNRIERRSTWTKFLLPLLLTLIAVFIKLEFYEENIQKVPYMLFIGIILISASYGGSRSALYATIITTVAMLLILVTPPYINLDSIQVNMLQASVFVAEAMMITGLIHYVQRTQRRFRLRERKFRGLVEKTEEGFFMMNEDGMITYFTPSVNKLLGYQEEDLRKREFYSLVHQHDVEEFKLGIYKLTANRCELKNWQCRLLTKSADYIWVEMNISNLLKDPSIRALVIHFNNITEKVQKDKQKDDFIHMATHELKSPVTVLKGYLQLLAHHFHKSDQHADQLRMLEKMDFQLDKLLTLISDMLDSSRINSGELNHHFASYNLNDCITLCVDAVKASNPDCQISYDLVKPDPILEGDKERISQVLTNFITNAIKYSPEDKNIRITSERIDGYIKVKVKDKGIGIAREKQPYIFDKFYRVDTLPIGVFDGLGLGLFICSEIIKKHGGNIGVNSVEGDGSEFWFCLPC